MLCTIFSILPSRKHGGLIKHEKFSLNLVRDQSCVKYPIILSQSLRADVPLFFFLSTSLIPIYQVLVAS